MVVYPAPLKDIPAYSRFLSTTVDIHKFYLWENKCDWKSSGYRKRNLSKVTGFIFYSSLGREATGMAVAKSDLAIAYLLFPKTGSGRN